MNAEALLALISQLYAQVVGAAARIAERDVLMQAARGGSGGGDIYVDVHVAGNAIYERDLAATVRSELQKVGRRTGRLGLA